MHIEQQRTIKRRAAASNSMFVRLGTDYKIRNGGYFKTIKNRADQFRYGGFQMARIVEDG